jgi:hypothetical protein
LLECAHLECAHVESNCRLVGLTRIEASQFITVSGSSKNTVSFKLLASSFLVKRRM